MSHLNLRFPPELLALDNQVEDAYLELRCQRARETFVQSLMQASGKSQGEVEASVNENFPPEKSEGLFLVPSKPRILPAEEPLQILSEEESRLCKWARAWLKVAKGIIG